MIDHVSVGVSDLNRSARFYERTLAPLGLSRLVTRPATIGFGKNYPEFWINLRADMGEVATSSGVHICLRAKSAAEVDAFHAAALDAGGRSDGGPGLRPHDRVRYYAAFIIDPDGNRIEAVSFGGIGIIKAGGPIRAPVSPCPRARATRRRVTAAESPRPARLSEYRPEAKDE
jgi:catechol 2,3-dioxygenase-like lactoylglutathione lyase family enzyme